MRGTAALLLRDLLAKLHPPTPATARESARLLNILDKSFQQHLDNAHPPPAARSRDVTQDSVPVEDSRSAHTHLESLLLHPLLETRRGEVLQHASRASAVDAFEASLRVGSLTLFKVKKIASRYLAELKSGPAPQSELRLGHKISAWLASENPLTKTAFFHSEPTLHEVVPVMYADGLESTVWAWLRSLLQREWVHDAQNLSHNDSLFFLRLEDNVVSEMMRMSIRRNSLQDAAVQYAEASSYRAQAVHVPVSSTATAEAFLQQPFLSSYRRISTAIVYRRENHGIAGSTFDQVLRFSVRFTSDGVITQSILQLYHPTNPTAEPFYNDLKDDSFAQVWNMWHSQHSMLHKALLTTILDAAQLSLTVQDYKKARFFFDFAETHWADYLPATRKFTDKSLVDRLSQARRDVTNQPAFNKTDLVPA